MKQLCANLMEKYFPERYHLCQEDTKHNLAFFGELQIDVLLSSDLVDKVLEVIRSQRMLAQHDKTYRTIWRLKKREIPKFNCKLICKFIGTELVQNIFAKENDATVHSTQR